MEHRKLEGLMSPMEKVARVASGGLRAASAQTSPSGAISLDNADGTRTIIGEVVNGEENPSYTMATHVGDTTPPGVPTGITATSKSGVVVVEWDGTLTDGIPDDFYCIRIYLDNVELGALSEAGSVASAKLESGTTHGVTATSEDDCCLPDGTPAHNVSEATQAISVTVAKDASEVMADIDEQIEGVEQEIADFKADTYTKAQTDKKVQDLDDEISTELTTNYYNKTQIDTTYATKTLVSQTKEEIELSASQHYATKGESQPNLSPFFAHDLADIYNATSNPDGYFVGNPASSSELGVVGTQLDDGWMHVEMDNSARTGNAFLNLYQRPIANLEPSTPYTLLIELRNVVTDAPYSSSFRITSQPDDATQISQTVNPNGYDDIYLARGGTFCKALATKPDMSAATLFCRQYIALAAGLSASFDIRLSLYETVSPEILMDTNAPTLAAVDAPWGRYVSDAGQTQVTATYGAIADPPAELGAGTYGLTLENDGTYAGVRARGLAFYTGATTGDGRPTYMEAGKSYQASWWARVTSGSAWGVAQYVRDGTTNQNQPGGTNRLALTSEWRRYTASLRPIDPDYSRLWISASYAASTAGKVEMCGFSLREMSATFKPYVTDQEELARTYATSASLTVGLDNIRSEVSETYATKAVGNPNLSPFLAHDITDVYNAATNPDGYWAATPANTTMLSDGWGHVVMDNSGGSASYRYFMVAPLQDETVPTTILVEIRNLVTDAQGVPGNRLQLSSQNRRLAAYTTTTVTEDGSYYFPVGVNDPASQWFCTVRPYLTGGNTAEFDIRISAYASAEATIDGQAVTLPYEGEYKPYVVQDSEITRSTTFKQTTTSLDGRITTTEDGLAVQQTLIRQYAGGVLVCKVGENIGALVNASGSFDVVGVSWNGDEPTVTGTFSTFMQSLIELGKGNTNAEIQFCDNTGNISVQQNYKGNQAITMDADNTTIHGDEDVYVAAGAEWGQYALVSELSKMVELHAATSSTQMGNIRVSPSSVGIDYTTSLGAGASIRMLDVTPASGSAYPVLDLYVSGGPIEMNASGGVKVLGPTGKGTAMRGVFSGSVVKNPNSSTTMTLLTAAQCQSTFGRALDGTKDVVVVTNGDTSAYGGTITGGTNASGALMATISATKAGAIRYNYLVILAA